MAKLCYIYFTAIKNKQIDGLNLNSINGDKRK